MAQTDPPVEDSDAPVPQDPKLAMAQKKFLLQAQTTSSEEKAKLEKELKEACLADDLAPTYEALCEELGWAKDEAAVRQMKQHNKEKLASLDEQLQDAEENLGDIEVRNACLAKADFLCSIGDRAAAAEAYRLTLQKTAGVGSKTDIVLSVLRQDMACGDWWAVRDGIKQAKDLCAKGGDWERKNRLKVYEALYAVSTRDFATAARLFLDSIATFTATELFTYEACIFFTVVTALITLPRQELKAKVVDAPEILTIISTIPHLESFLNSFYSCRYADFLQAFAALTDVIKADRYLQPHYRYYVREVRKAAYVQFLDAYKSVTLESMAQSFGVSAAFIDAELEEFIVAGRLTAKIDKVAGVVETNRADAKNAHYQATIKQGDLLLNRLQRLAKIIDVE